MNAIVCCACEGVPLAAQATWRCISGEKTPISWAGKNRISVLMELVPQNSPVYNHLLALSKEDGKFAYMIDWDMDGNIRKLYNLITEKEIK